jgi:hypothetical protein
MDVDEEKRQALAAYRKALLETREIEAKYVRTVSVYERTCTRRRPALANFPSLRAELGQSETPSRS